MPPAPFSSRPYIHWPLDRWKVGIALGLALLLLFTRGVVMPPAEPSPGMAENGPVGSGPVAAPAPTLPAPPATALPAAETRPTLAPRAEATPPGPPEPIPFSLRLLGSGATFLSNSRPVLFGQANPGQSITLRLDRARFEVTADEGGSWQFVFPDPLPLGMHWVRATVDATVDAAVDEPDHEAEPGPSAAEVMLLIGPNARPISPPTLDPPPAQPGQETTPLLQGNAPQGESLLMVLEEAEGRTILGPVLVDGDGRWQWQPSTPLEPGRYTLRVVVVDAQDAPLSQSPPAVVQVGPDDSAPASEPPQGDPP